MNEGNEEKLTKIHVDLPNHWGTSGESMWALPLGDDEYEVRNLPFYAYGINFLDHVRAVAASSEMQPEVLQVTKRSGHETIRVIFMDTVPQEQRMNILESLSELDVTFESATKKYFALDLEPEADMHAVRARLDQHLAAGILDYETCEEKVPGSFDDARS